MKDNSQVQNAMRDEIKELASDNVLMSAYLILQEAKELKALLALELQALRDDRKHYHKEIQELLSTIQDELIRIQSRFTVDATILSLIKPQQTGEEDSDTTTQPGRLGLQ